MALLAKCPSEDPDTSPYASPKVFVPSILLQVGKEEKTSSHSFRLAANLPVPAKLNPSRGQGKQNNGAENTALCFPVYQGRKDLGNGREEKG